MANTDNNKVVKSNMYWYKKEIKEKSQTNKLASKLDGIVRKLELDGKQATTIDHIVNLARALQNEDDDMSDWLQHLFE